MYSLSWWLSLSLLAAPAWAGEKYEVRLSRPVKEGARVRFASRGEARMEVEFAMKGAPRSKVNEALKWNLTGDVTVKAVTKRGTLKEVEFKVVEAEIAEDGMKTNLLKAGDTVGLLQGEKGEEIVTVNGAAAEMSVLNVFASVLDMNSEDQRTQGDLLDPAAKVEVGEEWEPRKDQLLIEAAQAKVTGLEQEDFTGKAKLEAVTNFAEQPALRISYVSTVETKRARWEMIGPLSHLKFHRHGVIEVPVATDSILARGKWTTEVECQQEAKAISDSPSINTMKRKVSSDWIAIPLP